MYSCLTEKSEKPYAVEHIHYDEYGNPRNIEVHAHPIFDHSGRLKQIIEHSIDITDRKKIEIEKDSAIAAQPENRAFLSVLMESIPVPVFYKDTDGRYIGFNQAFEVFYEKTKEELTGKSVFDISPPHLAKIYHEKDMELLKSNDMQIYETQVKNAKEEYRDVIFHKARIVNPRGEVTGLIDTILDITERKKQNRR